MQDVKDGEDCEDDEPEPEEDIDLLVEDVDGKDTLGIMSLDVTTGTVLVEGALGNPGKHPRHRVRPPLLLHLYEGGRGDAVGGELVAEEEVREEDLTDDVDQVETVGAEDVERPSVVFSESLHQVLGQGLNTLLSLLSVEVEPGQTAQQSLDFPLLHSLEDEVGQVEHQPLQEQDEGHPLVVSLHLDLRSARVVRPHASLGDVPANLRVEIFVVKGNDEGPLDPAVGVDDIVRYGVAVHAVNVALLA